MFYFALNTLRSVKYFAVKKNLWRGMKDKNEEKSACFRIYLSSL